MFKTESIKHIHFIGIGGCGMRGIAQLLLHDGYKVSGSDINQNAQLEELEQLGGMIFIGHDKDHIVGADVVVYSSAIQDDNIELSTARDQGVTVLQRAQMLAEMMRFCFSIAIAGTHGKTTTTSMVAHVLETLELDPSYVVGAKMVGNQQSARLGKSDYFVVEADESDASFLHYQPMVSVITNIDQDHMESYDHNPEVLNQAFLQFVSQMPFYGQAIVCVDDPGVRAIQSELLRATMTYGFSEDAMVRASNARIVEGRQVFDLQDVTGAVCTVDMMSVGQHNILNALAAYSVCQLCGVSQTQFVKAMSSFLGISRRFQQIGNFNFQEKQQILVFDDYGHHPQEIEATINTARLLWPHNRLVMCFQPHRYSRTKDLFDDFARVLALVDELYLMDVYGCHETPIEEVSSIKLAEKVKQIHGGALSVHLVGEAQGALSNIEPYLQSNDVLIFQGAGDITQVAVGTRDRWLHMDSGLREEGCVT